MKTTKIFFFFLKVALTASVIDGLPSWNPGSTAPSRANFRSTSMKSVRPKLTTPRSRWHCMLNPYNSLESSSDLVEGAYGNTNSRLIYGVFSTPNNAIAGSAICAFSLQVWWTSMSCHLCFFLIFRGLRNFMSRNGCHPFWIKIERRKSIV